jgi:hypothetical protein
MKIVKTLSVDDKRASQRKTVNRNDRIVIKMRTKKERMKKLGEGLLEG